ncbi:ribonucleoprotein PTB-binding 1-like [Numida meleagris]|uniref:ribonucleoprotein PTB-binding 1-like n=1 Tax=Numida meleagris TaxID=8996 RepID=UPI000B3DFBEE|nr:ribonucleoprotein PTB-binding 1-like [Numida meleagris]
MGGKQGLLGAAPSLPLGPGPALLQLALQNPTQKPGLLGESPLAALPHGAVGMATPSAAPLLGDPATGGDVPPCHPALQAAGGVAMTTERDSPAFTAALRGPASKHKRSDAAGPPSTGVSLLGEPPKDFKIPLNPYLNLHSLLPPGISGQPHGSAP